MDIAIIGAGMAGLTAAQGLVDDGHTVHLFDKGRGPGGRMSTRRAETPLGQCRFDHGAQVFSPRTDAFQSAVSGWAHAGAAAVWDGNFVKVTANGDIKPADDKPRYVGTPSMNAIIKHLAAPLAVTWGTRVSGIEGEPAAWTLRCEDGQHKGPFAAVIIAVPVEQARDLLAGIAPAFQAEANAVTSAPCWAAMAVFDMDLDAGFDAASFETGPIAWAARNSSKPGREGLETWVLHASTDWSIAHLEDPADAVAGALSDAFAFPETPIFLSAHRWRYSQVTSHAPTPAAWDEGLGIGVCGDWRAGPRIEDAWQSGRALAGLVPSS